ncbi:DNA mismatch repair endonuclease MutL [Neoehrlichia mikurensis]|uniref:DNA mismatch repair protein MutL n=1 Tax=Neoehrlichia mikurensis TaxID=89586 RepID=A0A9Q9BSA3_9RICK|nr:DNA mismatch repair endonuclease MutL [Neoehrlichia mikurensis]QXK92119.1 DNA mismatch repair endonuclease MutL [Neoehrlichia mikurensis]QXK92576.1 DNA mismatch repair endonuclease MutL [Neoehrlichia mikurensis]QXK93813.1 DNA mismatch repair endonuclease MutL [Neoehrlichia mikurensis]UTO55192.1 DNA mismatch repair endonuclease MutL [Neoehrlichia mikurensis]UTO56112.1 DNA mismatch repair endonuclease MutL [Neoehrlichia mikurensis]
MSIVLLDTCTINRIAAGEVIEYPANVIKELLENSIDAQSTVINIKIDNGGRNLISVSDNGVGIPKQDIEMAFLCHATSKLVGGDLINIRSLGFRGEGLTSIAAVSKVKLISKYVKSDVAWSIVIAGGEKVQDLSPDVLSCGTNVEVRDLFFATPTRLKFLRTEQAETQHIIEIINKLAIINYHIAFSLYINDKLIFKYLKQNEMVDRLSEIKFFGTEFKSNALKVSLEESAIKLNGYASLPTFNKSRPNGIYTFVNNRPINDYLLMNAVKYAYSDFIVKDRYPVVVLYFDVPFDQVDVNVHPNKLEVRFQNKKLVYNIVVKALRDALSKNVYITLQDGNLLTYDVNDPFIYDNIEKICDEKKLQKLSLNSHVSQVEPGKSQGHCDVQLSSNSNLQSYELSDNTNNTSEIDSYALRNDDSIDVGKRENFSDTIRQSLCDTDLTGNVIKQSTFLYNKKRLTLQDDIIQDYPLGYAICQLYNKYIISSTKKYVIIVDQHAAHERLTYEYMKKVMNKDGIKRQLLIMPEIVELNNEYELELLLEHEEQLLQLGLLFKSIGSLAIVVREVPAIFGSFNIKALMIKIIDNIIEFGNTLFMDKKIKDICATIACYSSIRSGRKLHIEEMNSILRQMECTAYSGQCNHGRPTYIKLSLAMIDKLFERT